MPFPTIDTLIVNTTLTNVRVIPSRISNLKITMLDGYLSLKNITLAPNGTGSNQNASSISVINGDVDLSFRNDVNMQFSSNTGMFCFHGAC